jgi:hypothetical protein
MTERKAREDMSVWEKVRIGKRDPGHPGREGGETTRTQTRTDVPRHIVHGKSCGQVWDSSQGKRPGDTDAGQAGGRGKNRKTAIYL